MTVFERRTRTTIGLAAIVLQFTLCLFVTLVVASGVSADEPLIDPPLSQVWETVLPGEQSARSLLAQGGVVYMLTDEGIVHALSAADGQPIWETSGWLLPEARPCPYDPPKLRSVSHSGVVPAYGTLLALDGDLVIAAICAGWENYVTDQQILLLDKATGQLRGTWPVIGGRLVAVHDGVLVLASQDLVYGVGLAEQREVWRVPSPSEYNFGFFKAASGSLLFLQSTNAEWEPVVSVYSAKNGAVLWQLPVGGDWIIGGSSGDVIFTVRVGDERNELLALESQTGDVLWQSDISDFNVYAGGYDDSLGVAAVDGAIYIYSRSLPGRMAAFESDTGVRVWDVALPVGVRSILALGSVLYCVGIDDEGVRLHALSAEDGQVVWSGLSDPGLSLGPVEHSIMVVATSQPGTLGDDAVISAFRQRS